MISDRRVDGMRTENWGRYRIGSGESVNGYLQRLRAELSNLENASRIQYTGRRVWGTHVYPGGCWICDTFGVAHGLLALLEEGFPGEAEVNIEAKSSTIDSGQPT